MRLVKKSGKRIPCGLNFTSTIARRWRERRHPMSRVPALYAEESGCYLEDDAAAALTIRGSAAAGGGAVQVAAGVECHVAVWISTVAAAGKVVQRGVGPAGGACQFEDRAVPMSPVSEGGAVKITDCVHGQVGIGSGQRTRASKAVKQGERPARSEEHTSELQSLRH